MKTFKERNAFDNNGRQKLNTGPETKLIFYMEWIDDYKGTAGKWAISLRILLADVENAISLPSSLWLGKFGSTLGIHPTLYHKRHNLEECKYT